MTRGDDRNSSTFKEFEELFKQKYRRLRNFARRFTRPAAYTVNANLRLPFSTDGNDEVPNDLRKVVFFRPAPAEDGGVVFRGSYTGRSFLFSGLSVDVVYLSRAEARVRLGDIGGGMGDLNTLVATRYRPGTLVPYSASTVVDAIPLILLERREETLFREVWWTDLRRLNQDPLYAVSLFRVLGGAGGYIGANGQAVYVSHSGQ